MCIRATGVPTFVHADEATGGRAGLLLWKALRVTPGGEHVSSRGLTYPLGQTVLDPKGAFGDHLRCIHLLPTRAAAERRGARHFGDHVVAMLAPLGRVWTSPEWPKPDEPACWHTDRCIPLYCVTCQAAEVRPEARPEDSIPAKSPAFLPDPVPAMEAARQLADPTRNDAALIEAVARLLRQEAERRPAASPASASPASTSPMPARVSLSSTADAADAFLRSGARPTVTLPDGVMVRAASDPAVYLIVGGAKLPIPESDWIAYYGGWHKVATVPDGDLRAIPSVPRDGTLLREFGDPAVYGVRDGNRHCLTSEEAARRFGDYPSGVTCVPRGTLWAIPRGPDLS